MNLPPSDLREGIPASRLAHFPITFFGMTMGILGLALACSAASLPEASQFVAGAGTLVLAMLLGLYVAKAIRFPGQVAAEWNHPVRLAFFPAANISVLLLSLLLRDIAPNVSAVMWVLGAIAQAVITVVIVSAWISQRSFDPAILSPVWFIPAVANAIVPLGGVHLGQMQVSWFFFSVGMLFWVLLLTLVFHRLIFGKPLPEKLRPTFAILIAPPSVGFLAWTGLNGGRIDAPAHMLINAALFFSVIVAVQLPGIMRLPFSMSFWALTFPLAALTTAFFRYAALTGLDPYRFVGMAMLGLLVVTTIVLGGRTIRAVVTGDVFQPE